MTRKQDDCFPGLTYAEARDKVLEMNGTHWKLKDAIRAFDGGDPVDAYHNALALAALQRKRIEEDES